jgi:Zn-dependent M16 (insulinase) family peptidase
VLAGVLRNGYLHRAIREQGGAYGAGASQDNMAATFRLFSYRDPRIDGTLADFDAALDWIANSAPSQDAIDEAVLGVISAMDKPGTPAGEAIQAFHSELSGRSKADIERYRAAVLAVSSEDLQRVAGHYLTAERAQTAVVTGASAAAQTGWSSSHV